MRRRRRWIVEEICSFRISPDHGLIQQIKLVLNDIYSIFPKITGNYSPWVISSPAGYMKKQLKRTISLPLIGGMNRERASFLHEISILQWTGRRERERNEFLMNRIS